MSSQITLDFITAVRNTVAFNLAAIDQVVAEAQLQTDATAELRAKAFALFYAGFYEQAKPILNALVAIDPVERNIVKLAQTELRLGNFDRAIAIAGSAIRADPGSFPAWEVIATAQLGLGRYSDAVDAANRALAIKPDARRPATIKAAVEKLPVAARAVASGGELSASPLLNLLIAPTDSSLSHILADSLLAKTMSQAEV